tara:strand:+ start:8633 stop:9511 length:879 start_codon:yes stop_codon:yes gene_type:complete
VNRLITFGCSFTDGIHWPSWSDFMGSHYKEYINKAKGGSGNSSIFQSVCNALQQGTLKPGDDVVIQWSSCLRVDNMLPTDSLTTYAAAGTVYNNYHYTSEYVDKYFSIYQSVFETINYIYSIKEMLTSNKINYGMTFMMDPTIDKFFGEPCYGGFNGEPTKEQIRYGLELLPELKKLIDSKFTSKCMTMHQLDKPAVVYTLDHKEKIVRDGHPSPIQHRTFFYKYITPLFPQHDFSINSKNIKLADQWEEWTKISDDIVQKKKLGITLNWPSKERYKAGVLQTPERKVTTLI